MGTSIREKYCYRISSLKMLIRFYLLLMPVLLLPEICAANATNVLRVGKGQSYGSIKAAIAASSHGDTVIISAGLYQEGNIIIDKSIFIQGEGKPILDGQLKFEILSVKANHVTIKGLVLKNSGRSAMDDPGAIKVYDASNVLIEGNTLLDNYFGVYLQYSKNCIVKNNFIRATQLLEHQSGNGIHCWKSDSLQIIGNKTYGHRDGIYFEFVTHSIIWRNLAYNNLRYGLHFMFSNDNAYISNLFKNNGAGVAVMFTKKVVMINNSFEDNLGDAAYGLLFKEISDCYLSGNKFIRNTTGIFFDGSNRIIIERNIFKENGWGMRLQANCMDNVIQLNNFLGNTFDMATNGSLTLNMFSENYWDKYQGYDLNRDKIGDVPYHPLSLYAVIVEQNPPAMLLYRSFMVNLLDQSEKLSPSLTPENFVDNKPSMAPHNL